jgi:hypothetical protein
MSVTERDGSALSPTFDRAGANQLTALLSPDGDGNPAVVGGPYDNRSTGAVWVFTRSGADQFRSFLRELILRVRLS